MRAFAALAPSAEERRASLPGDDLVVHPDAVMDRAFSLEAAPELVWPWLVQLGKRRAGWYLPRPVERLVPSSRRGIRAIDPRWQRLAVGDVVPDYGGRTATFLAAVVEPPRCLVYRSRRGDTNVSWAIVLTPASGSRAQGTRVHLRLRLGPVRHRWLIETGGELVDALTIAGLAAGLAERLRESRPA